MFGRRKRGKHHAGRAATPPVYNDATEVFERIEEPSGPFDQADAPADELQRLDLGSVRVVVPDGAQLQVEVDPSGPVRAVHFVLPEGQLTVSAYAAPRSGELWPEIMGELMAQLRQDGATVSVETGEWGRELLANVKGLMLRFLGVDGPRWMLRGVVAGPEHQVSEAARSLRNFVRQTIVVRGNDPLPVRTPLPIELPPVIAEHIEQARNG